MTREEPATNAESYPYRLGRVTAAARIYLLTGTPRHRTELAAILNEECSRGTRVAARPSEAELLTALRRTLASAVELHELGLECWECPRDHEDTGEDCPVLVSAQKLIDKAEGRP